MRGKFLPRETLLSEIVLPARKKKKKKSGQGNSSGSGVSDGALIPDFY